MASIVQICNQALLKFGNVTITSLEDGSVQADACKVLYPLMRDEITNSHPWNYAMGRADISAKVATSPAFPSDMLAYTLPTDCLRVFEFYGTDVEWAIEGNNLLTTQDEEIFIRYIKQVTTSGDFPPSVVECIAVRLAAELAVKIRDDKGLRQELLAELEKVVLPTAYHLNAVEGKLPRNKDEQPLDEGNYSWQMTGRSSNFVKWNEE